MAFLLHEKTLTLHQNSTDGQDGGYLALTNQLNVLRENIKDNKEPPKVNKVPDWKKLDPGWTYILSIGILFLGLIIVCIGLSIFYFASKFKTGNKSNNLRYFIFLTILGFSSINIIYRFYQVSYPGLFEQYKTAWKYQSQQTQKSKDKTE